MRILLCNYEYPPIGGGGGVFTASLAQQLARRHDVTVLTSGARGLPDHSVDHGVRVVRVPAFLRRNEASADILSLLWYIPAAIAVGQDLLAHNSVDVINTHFALPTGPVGHMLSKWAGVPNILSLHGGDLYDPSKFLSPHRHFPVRSWVRRILKSATVVVGQSSDTIQNARRFYTRDLPITRIPLGIELPNIIPARRVDYEIREDEVLFVTVGRLVRRKAIDRLIEVMARMNRSKVRLIVIGTGPQERELRQQCYDHHIEDRVMFTGKISDVEKFQILNMSDVYVSTSRHEGFGIVFLEAMASKLPVVCYDHGGQVDFLREGRTGHLVPFGDEDQFYARCAGLLDNSVLRRQMGEHNKQYVHQFSIERCAEQYESVFEQARQKISTPSQVTQLTMHSTASD